MSAPIVWILFPGAAAVVLALLRRFERLVVILGAVVGVVLAFLAWQVPIGGVLDLGPIDLPVTGSLIVLGRRFVLTGADRPALAVLYLAVALWAGGVYLARAGRIFVPFSLAAAAIVVSALSVQPFLYAALLGQIAVLLCIPILSPPGRPASRGVLRFLTFQTFGLPFILLTGWLLEEQNLRADDPALLAGAAVLLGLGFTFLLAVFPFHTWVPMLAQEANPYSAAYVFFLLPGGVTIFSLGFLSSYPWLQADPQVFTFLRTAGTLMVLTGGVWAAFQTHLGRLMGYGVLVDIGISLLLIGAQQGDTGLVGNTRRQLVYLLAGRGAALAVWSFALVQLKSSVPDLRYSAIQGLARRLPFASAAVFLACLSFAGFPPLTGAASRLDTFARLAPDYPALVFLALLGCFGVLAGGLRGLGALVTGREDGETAAGEPASIRILLALGMILMVALGLLQ